MEETRKKLSLAIIPAYNHYTEILVNADVYAIKFSSQIEEKIWHKDKFVFFDEYVDQNLGRKYNEQAVQEALNHSVNSNGELTEYKGLSLVDIDHAAIYCSVFLYYYREALSFITLIEHFKPSKIIIGADDPNQELFEELAKQSTFALEIVKSFGTFDQAKSELIRRSNKSVDIQKWPWHICQNQNNFKKAITRLLNCWSRLIFLFKKRKPFIYIDNCGQLNKIKTQLCSQKEYCPLYRELNRLPLRVLLSRGFRVLNMNRKVNENIIVNRPIKNYQEYLEQNKNNSLVFGQIKFNSKTYTIANIIARRLIEYAPDAFKQIANAIDSYEKFITKEEVHGALLSSDMNWENRMIVRLFQKHQIENMVQMNGWFGVEHMVENKSAVKVLCFGESYRNNYFRDKKNILLAGCPTFDFAFQKRTLVGPQYPIRKILISTFTFSPADINCHYHDSEKYLNDILTVIREYKRGANHELFIALRPHPSDTPDFYRWYLDKIGLADVPLELDKNFQGVVANYDLYFGSYSTTIFETACMGIPVIFYHPCNQILNPPFDKSCRELPIAMDFDELKTIFNRVMQDKNYAYLFTEKKSLAPYVDKLDGTATSKIIDELLRMATIKEGARLN